MIIKSKLGFIYRGIIGIKDNLFNNPTIININSFSIGRTIGGEEIKCYKFGNGEEKILYFGGIHGNEIGTIKLMNEWVNYLSNNVNSIENKQIFIIPCLNIDGYKKAIKNPDYFNGGTIGKTNSNNVDLNRNFPTLNWSEKTKLFVSGKYTDISGGSNPASENEISAFLSLIKKEKIKIIYTFHNCWGTVFSLNSNKRQYEYSKYSNYRIFTEKEWNFLCEEQKTGHSMLWGKENNIEIIEVELKRRWGSEWKKNKKALLNSIKN